MMIEKLVLKNIPRMIVVGEATFGHSYNDMSDIFQDRIEIFPEGCMGFFQKNSLIGFTTTEIWSRINKISYDSKASENHDGNGHLLYVSDMAVLPTYQSKGIGSLLLKEIIHLAKKMNLDSIYLGTTKARKFYEKNGFQFIKHVAEDKSPYDIMELKLTP